MSFISVAILLMTLLQFSSFDCFISDLIFIRLSPCIFYCKLCYLINVVGSDAIFLEVNKLDFCCLMVNPLYLVGSGVSTLFLSLDIWPPVTAGINLFLIVLSRGSGKWRIFGMFLRKQSSLFLNPLVNAE